MASVNFDGFGADVLRILIEELDGFGRVHFRDLTLV